MFLPTQVIYLIYFLLVLDYPFPNLSFLYHFSLGGYFCCCFFCYSFLHFSYFLDDINCADIQNRDKFCLKKVSLLLGFSVFFIVALILNLFTYLCLLTHFQVINWSVEKIFYNSLSLTLLLSSSQHS